MCVGILLSFLHLAYCEASSAFHFSMTGMLEARWKNNCILFSSLSLHRWLLVICLRKIAFAINMLTCTAFVFLGLNSVFLCVTNLTWMSVKGVDVVLVDVYGSTGNS